MDLVYCEKPLTLISENHKGVCIDKSSIFVLERIPTDTHFEYIIRNDKHTFKVSWSLIQEFFRLAKYLEDTMNFISRKELEL